jgi:hypothetical protein
MLKRSFILLVFKSLEYKYNYLIFKIKNEPLQDMLFVVIIV